MESGSKQSSMKETRLGNIAIGPLEQRQMKLDETCPEAVPLLRGKEELFS